MQAALFHVWQTTISTMNTIEITLVILNTIIAGGAFYVAYRSRMNSEHAVLVSLIKLLCEIKNNAVEKGFNAMIVGMSKNSEHGPKDDDTRVKLANHAEWALK